MKKSKNKKQRYVDPDESLAFECKKHPGVVQHASYNEIMAGYECVFCSSDRTGIKPDLSRITMICDDCGREYRPNLDDL